MRRVRYFLLALLIVAWLVTGLPLASPVPIPHVSAATQTFNTSGSWQAPTDVSSVVVEAWGAGGAGGGRGAVTGQSGGGGGGAYASATIAVTAGNNYSYTVGTGGTGGTGNGPDGGFSQWATGTAVKAAGGKGGLGTTTKGLGGATADSAGTTLYKGGDGADATGAVSGGGGGGAGSTGAGGNATAGTAGTGTTVGGGTGGAGQTNANGVAGSAAGGGGSGARRTSGNRSGGSGANGQIKITYAIVSVTVADASVSYGLVSLGSTRDTTSGGANDTQVATNAGDSPETFNIRGQDSANWTLASSAGSNQYVHWYCTAGSGSPDPCDAGPTWTALTTSYQTLGTNIAAAGTRRFDLRIGMPTSSGNLSQQTVDVTIQAVQF